MGYTTQFIGEISIKPELKASQIKFIQGMFGDIREWNPEDAELLDLTHFDFEFNEGFTGIRWDGSEKFYSAVECMQYIIDKSLEKWSELKFEGILQAQGEEFDDRWKLVVSGNKAEKINIAPTGKAIECPHCEEKFELEG